jgi:peptidoglycan/xylan/chitin deacetylase (PgdA/CDA1 family)
VQGAPLLTTSWDDGHPLDLRVAELLAKYGLPGCFYVPRHNPEREVMADAHVRELATRFEVGAHTINHVRLTRLPSARAREEIVASRAWLADVLGAPVASFCYPGGLFDREHVRMVREAGFSGARTADWLCFDLPDDAFRMAPSLHFFPHSSLMHVAHCLRRGHLGALLSYLSRLGRQTQLHALVDRMIELVAQRGGVLHLWGHSWEIDALGLWPELERVLSRLADRRADFRLVDNAALARVCPRRG